MKPFQGKDTYDCHSTGQSPVLWDEALSGQSHDTISEYMCRAALSAKNKTLSGQCHDTINEYRGRVLCYVRGLPGLGSIRPLNLSIIKLHKTTKHSSIQQYFAKA